MEYFFEKMAARGWMLRDAVGSFWGFERQTPKKVKFSVRVQGGILCVRRNADRFCGVETGILFR